MAKTLPDMLFEEFAEMLADYVPIERLLDFKVSATTQARLRKLLEKNKENRLTEQENYELKLLEAADHFVSMLCLTAQRRRKQDREKVQTRKRIGNNRHVKVA